MTRPSASLTAGKSFLSPIFIETSLWHLLVSKRFEVLISSPVAGFMLVMASVDHLVPSVAACLSKSLLTAARSILLTPEQ